MIDVGAIWETNIDEAKEKILQDAKITWLEEPFYSIFLWYGFPEITKLPLAGGESCHSIESAKT